MQTLAVVPLAGHRVMLPSGVDHAAAHAELAALLTRAAGAETAGLFAEPRLGTAEVEYLAPDGRIARFDELDAEGRALLRAEIGRLVSLLRRAAEEAAQREPARCGSWPALVANAIEIPSFERVYAHEGRPVLAGWGMAPATAPAGLGLIGVLDDGRAYQRPLAFPLWAAVLSLLALLAIGAMGAMATPRLIDLFDPPEPVCRVAPADQQAFLELDGEKKRELELRRRLAALQQSAGDKRAACPIPTVPAPTPPSPPVQRAAPEPPKPAPTPPKQQAQPKPPPPLPADRWARKDLSLLKGCWVLGKPTMSKHGLPNGRSELCTVNAGRICFGDGGLGQREMTSTCPSGHVRCVAPIQAGFSADSTLRTTQPQVSCDPPGLTWIAENNSLVCRRTSDTLAICRDPLNFEHEFRRDGP
jgi:hypothetical protein